MNRVLKYTLWSAGALVGTAAAAVAYLAFTFDPNAYKPQIIQAVQDRTQRQLRLDGDITLSFYPNIGAQLGGVALSEFKSAQEFAAVDSARVSLAFLPLLRKQVVVNEVAVSGLRATLVKHADGSTNIDDLLKGDKKEPDESPTPAQPVDFNIRGLTLDKAQLSYRDEASGASYALKDLRLQTGRVAPGLPSPIELATTVQASEPKLDLALQFKTVLTADLAAQRYGLKGMALSLGGSALDITGLKATLSGDLQADLAAQAYGVTELALQASGRKGQDPFDATLKLPALSMAKDRYTAEPLTLAATMDAAFGKLVARLAVPSVEGDLQAFKMGPLQLDATLTQPAQTIELKLSSPVAGDLKTRQFALSDLRLAAHASGEALPNKAVRSELKGNVQLDLAKESVQARLAGGLLQSQVKLQAGVNGFKAPAIAFDLDVDQFDLDQYLPKTAAPKEKAPAAAPEQPFDLAALRPLKLDGQLRVGALKAAGVRATELRVDLKARNGLLNVNPLSVNLYQGSARLNATVNAAPATPAFAVQGQLAGVEVAPLLKDLLDLDIVEGKGNITLNLTTAGSRVSALKKGLDGSMALNLANGAIKGINLSKLAQGVQTISVNSSKQTLGLDKSEKTAFTAFKASFKLANGVAHNEDLAVSAPLLAIAGRGDIDIGNDSLDYTTRVSLSKTEGGGAVTVPVQLSGPFAALKYRVDYGAVVKDVVKQKTEAKVEQKKEELKAKAQEKLENKLKGLFGR